MSLLGNARSARANCVFCKALEHRENVNANVCIFWTNVALEGEKQGRGAAPEGIRVPDGNGSSHREWSVLRMFKAGPLYYRDLALLYKSWTRFVP